MVHTSFEYGVDITKLKYDVLENKLKMCKVIQVDSLVPVRKYYQDSIEDKAVLKDIYQKKKTTHNKS